MGTHVALLRGINVGGKNKLAMKRLVALFEAAGCEDVRTYIQSGNVVFESPAALAKRVPELVRVAIADELGLEVPVVTRTAKELAAVVRSNPFAKAGADESLLHVAFLAERPSRARVAALDPDRSPPDELAVKGREVYLHCPNGVARTKLTNAYLDRTLGTVSTARNWRTTRKLLEMAGG
jgi:uncharacterized protein (DUF1697 family)